MRKKFSVYAISAIMALAITACGNLGESTSDKTSDVTVAANESADETSSDNAKKATSDAEKTTDSKVAGGDETVEAVDIVTDDMVEAYAKDINDGTYDVETLSSSAMFKITKSKLVVADGEMTLTITMNGTGYEKVYRGTGEEAVNANEENYTSYEEDADGAYTFTFSVDAVDKGIDLAAFSKRKEKWYDRVIVIKKSSLPEGALKVTDKKTVSELGIEDGTYTVDVTLLGGSGRASVESPATIKVEGGNVTADIIWSSKNYDYMKVGEEKYLPINAEGENSAFEIPVDGFDYAMPVKADTVAMSTPHEIEYTLTFDSSSIKAID